MTCVRHGGAISTDDTRPVTLPLDHALAQRARAGCWNDAREVSESPLARIVFASRTAGAPCALVLGQRFGVAPTTVNYWLRKRGVKLRTRGRYW